MNYLLDTNVVSEAQKPFGNTHVRDWLHLVQGDRLFLSVLTVGEIRRRTSEMAAVISTHHTADPNITPSTSPIAGCHPEPTCTPSPAKTARNSLTILP